MKLQNAVKGALAIAVVSLSLCLSTVTAQAAGTLKVTDSAKIRSTASTSSEPVGSTSKGAKLDVVSSVEPGDGYTWYKVKVEGDKVGYIRGDLVTDVSGDISSEGGTSTTTATTTDSTATTAPTVNPSEMTAGTTKDSVNVRSSASTKSDQVAKAEKGQVVTITGEATDNDGKKWYEINYNGIKGFIRSDYIDATKPAEETPVEATDAETEVVDEWADDADFAEESDVVEAPAPVVSQDYELVFEADKEGVEKWFLHDNIKNTRQSLDNIFAIMEQNSDKKSESKANDSVLRIVVIVLGVLLVISIIVIAILGFKLKDSYEDWEDDDEDDDDDDDEDDYVAISRKQPVAPVEDDDDDEDEDIKIVTRKGGKPKKTAATGRIGGDKKEGWQSKNFLEIDDDMEFEFLDIDNK